MLYSVVGLQFGDEGKGKFVDYLAGKIKHIARFNGGANAGHCVQVKINDSHFHSYPLPYIKEICIFAKGINQS